MPPPRQHRSRYRLASTHPGRSWLPAAMWSPGRHASRRPPIPQTPASRESPRTPAGSASSRASPLLRAIAIVDDLQSFQREVVADFFDVFTVASEQSRQAAGRENLLQGRQLTLHARQDSVDEAEVAEVKAGLHVDDGVRAD